MRSSYIFVLLLGLSHLLLAQIETEPMPEMGGNFKPNYESYKLSNFITENEATYSGNLQFSIPLLTVPGRHGHNFDIVINYSSDIRQRQFASWVGLGWELDIGAVERTINGRADEPGHNCSYGSLGLQNCTGKGNMGGRFKADFLNDPLEYRDIADQYQLLIDGGGVQIIPFSDSLMITFSGNYDSTVVDYDDFLTVQYKPWFIGSYLDFDGAFKGFIVHKEDGTEYTYGNIGTVGIGQVEWKKVSDMGLYSNPPQQYKFPYRWNLNQIKYADGSSTTIQYEFQNDSNNRLYQRYESVMIDRSKVNNVGNYFGNIPFTATTPCASDTPPAQDSVFSEFAHPKTLLTDTHYLVFETTQTENTNDNSSRNCKLNAIILYERYTNKELKRVVFNYAENNNPNDCGISSVNWDQNERLNNNQLTLIGFSILSSGNTTPPKNNIEDLDPITYRFTYTTNPKVSIEGISRYVTPSYPDWPGHFSLSDAENLGIAWRLRSVLFPTGGKCTYDYETYKVNFDPEGNYDNSVGWNFTSEPTSRVVSKTIEDGFDSPRLWNYSYSPEVIYDPPASVNQSSFVPSIFRSGFHQLPSEYYKWVRSCNVAHRWVKISNPDGSWKKKYYTSSYQGTDANIKEKYPDYFLQSNPQVGAVISKSYAGCRGIIWKEEVGQGTVINRSVINDYFFQPQAYLKERYDYFMILGPLQGRVYAINTSFWPRLDKTTTTIDNVTTVTDFNYSSTPRWIADGNGLIISQTVVADGFEKMTNYNYAYKQYPEMMLLGMFSQLVSTTVRRSVPGRVGVYLPEYSEYTTWSSFSNLWLPHQIYQWNGDPEDEFIDDPPNKYILFNTFSYDFSGYGNIITKKDANDFVTKYFYGDASNPFVNTTEGLKKGYVTGVEYPLASSLLRTSYKYDHYGNIIEKTDENLNTTKVDYDELGRIIRVTDPLNRITNEYLYSLPSNSSLITPSNPNSITDTQFRSQNDFTVFKYFYDGTGNLRQLLTSLGNKDLISAYTYDLLWRVQRTYKTYQIDLGLNQHKFDVNFNNNCISYYGFNKPYLTNEYYNDGLGRIEKTLPEGETWQTHPIQYSYSSSQGKYFITSTLNENGINSLEYSDKLNRKIRSILDPNGLNLVTEFGYDIMDRIIGVKPPSRPYYEYETSTTSYMPYPTTSKMMSIDVPEDNGRKYFQVIVSSDVGHERFSKVDGTENLCPYIRFTYQQFLDGALVYESPNIGLALECDGNRESLIFESPIKNADNIRLNVYEVEYYSHQIDYDVTLEYKSVDNGFTSEYVYNKRGNLVKKVTEDAGTVEYSYDKVRNLRFTKDANQLVTGKFTYYKYDELNRLVQTGLYTGSSSFTNTNAENINFPVDDDPNKTVNEQYYFDNSYYTGQRNLLGRLSKSTVNKNSSTVQTSYYSYDEMGRVEWLVRQIPGLPDVKISYWYDYQGNPTKKCLSDATNGSVYTFYEYDAAGRLSKVYTNYLDSEVGKIKEAEYTYNADGTRKRVQLGDSQGMDYVYNERGWVKQINQQNFNITQDPGGDGGAGTTTTVDKFAEIIGYEEQGHIAAGTGFTFQPQYNGNISWSFSRIKDVSLSGVNAGYPDPMIGYVYNYDNANRLTKADFGYYHATSGWNNTLPKSSMYELPLISYSPDGNISSLQRFGVNATMENNFAYAYQPNTNRLATLTNTASGTQTYNYGYDQNGNVISDQLRDITNVVYNSNNLPEQLVNSIDATVNYTYDEGNNRIRKQDGTVDEYYILGATGETEAVYSGTGSIKFVNILAGENLGRLIPITSNLSLTNTTLVGNYQAQNSITAQTNVVVNGTAALKTPGTIYLKPGFRANSGCNFTVSVSIVETDKFYYLKDHLGSIRVTVDKLGSICSYDDYDPYGLQLAGRSGNFGYTNDKYKFTGKERDIETGYDYFGARYYDSKIGRWLQVDPLADKYPEWSPYNYCLNNPLVIIDPTGMAAVDATPDDSDEDSEPNLDPKKFKAKADEFKQNRKELDEAWNTGNWWDIVVAGFNVGVDALEKGLMESAGIPGPSAIVITGEMISGAVISAEVSYNSQISVGARELAKKIGHANSQGFTSAFNGIKPTTQNATQIIKDVLSNPKISVVGKQTSDFYNSVGQGVRLYTKTGKFHSFIEIAKRTR